ncbi:MAG: shikimate kinase [Paludibacteraceae bacterium]|nr:shikimate kinase [Paludibacteraceae bacterium]
MKSIFLVGFMGSGKTTIGKVVAHRLGFQHLDLDVYIENKYHKTVSQIFAEVGEREFRDLERKALQEVIDFEQCVISTGGGTPCFFDNMQQINSHGISFYLRVDSKVLADRLFYKGCKRPLLAGKNKEELLDYIEKTIAQRESFYSEAKVVINANDTQVAIDQICDLLANLKIE